MTQHIVTIIGDSLALPRPEDNLFERDLYPARLQSLLGPSFFVVNRSTVGNYAIRAGSQETAVYAIQGTQAGCYVIQFGIVDCAPRLFTLEERTILVALFRSRLLKRFARAWVDYRSRRRFALTKEMQILRTPPDDFEMCYRNVVGNILALTQARKIVAINIAAPGASLVDRSYGIAENVERYNEIIGRIASEHTGKMVVMDVYSETKRDPSLVLADGHHLCAALHARIAERLAAIVAALDLGEPARAEK